ncbi:hypothetical protein ACHAXR_005838 [Thalassiosira sp. AJA248-18]
MWAMKTMRLLLAAAILTWMGSATETAIAHDSRQVQEEELQNITLRGGVLLAPPFAIYDEDNDVYTGFQGDLLKSLEVFAKQDGYNLQFDLDLSPPQYNVALDLVANDCNTSANPNLLEDCQRFDLIIGDYYCNAARSVRVDFSPTWLRTTMSTLKTIKDDDDEAAQLTDYTTLTQLQSAEGGTACVPEGTYLRTVVMEKFPKANYLDCPSPADCVSYLKEGKCMLYADDELMLRYRALNDPSLEVTGEQFNTQYIVWSINYALATEKSRLLKKWMYASVANATLDLLSYKYFTVKLCPLGLAGEKCDLNCDPKHGTSDRYGQCVCHSNKWTGDDCSIEVEEDLNMFPEWEIAMCYAFFGINTLACIICAIWIYWERNTKQVKAWQPFFLNIVLLGCLISSSSIITLVQQSDTDEAVHACAVFPWLYSIGFSMTFGALYAKIFRVYMLFQAAAVTRRITVTKLDTLKWVCLIMCVDIIICTVWTVVDPMEWTRSIVATDIFGEPLESVGYCTSSSWKIFASLIACWHLALLFRACFLCYQTRHISTSFAESNYLAVAMISHLQIFAISIPILVIVGADPKSSLFIRGGDDLNVSSAIRSYTRARESSVAPRGLRSSAGNRRSSASSNESGMDTNSRGLPGGNRMSNVSSIESVSMPSRWKNDTPVNGLQPSVELVDSENLPSPASYPNLATLPKENNEEKESLPTLYSVPKPRAMSLGPRAMSLGTGTLTALDDVDFDSTE